MGRTACDGPRTVPGLLRLVHQPLQHGEERRAGSEWKGAGHRVAPLLAARGRVAGPQASWKHTCGCTPSALRRLSIPPLTGTFVSAFAVLCGARTDLPDRHVCCVFWLNIAAALIQTLTAIVMVGWIMSIFWGMDMVILASE